MTIKILTQKTDTTEAVYEETTSTTSKKHFTMVELDQEISVFTNRLKNVQEKIDELKAKKTSALAIK